MAGDLYTPEADAQLDELAGGPDVALYNAVLGAIDHILDQILDQPDTAKSVSPPLRDAEGRSILATAVRHEADPRWFVFWTVRAVGPVILGVAPLPSL